MAPVWNEPDPYRGTVSEGPVGPRWAGRFRLFRYEVRCWRGGRIPDVAEAVESPRRLTDDPRTARTTLSLVGQVPTPTWGRDELGTGEMWNSNSLIAWLLARGGLYREDVRPPRGGRAPGWDAGLVVARRQRCSPDAGELEARPEDVEHVKVRGKRGSVDSPQEAGGGLPMARAAARARLSE